MKDNKGKQVFSDNMDEILVDKIIEHSEANSEDASTINQEETKTPDCCTDEESCGTIKKAITFSVILISFLLFISIIIKGKKKKIEP